jgi:transposase InsO family protein
MVKTKIGLKLKCLRSDNGGEYEDGGFKRFCAVNGIRIEKTILGTPQQNGVAERINKTLNECARSMRLHAGLGWRKLGLIECSINQSNTLGSIR